MTTNNTEALRARARATLISLRIEYGDEPGKFSLEREALDTAIAALASQPQAAGAGGDAVLAQLRRELAADKGGDYTAYEQGRLAEKRRCIDLLTAQPQATPREPQA